MEPFIRYLEARSSQEAAKENNLQKPIVKEWGISHTSLEDVFLEVTKREQFTYPYSIPKQYFIFYNTQIPRRDKQRRRLAKINFWCWNCRNGCVCFER